MTEIRRWTIKRNDEEHQIEYVVRWKGDGEVLIDGKIVTGWGSSWWGLPKTVDFQISDKSATLRRIGIVSQHFDLIYEGKVYSEKQGRT